MCVRALLARYHELKPPCIITMNRLGRRLDDDNLAGACKPLRDGIADAFGLNDRDSRIKWVPAQSPAPKGVMGCAITISFCPHE